MSDDLLDVLTGGKERLTPKRDATDYVIRTVYGEADPNDKASRQAVAGVIVNRAKKANQPYDQVVLAPNQFSAWEDPKARARMEALDPNSDEYKAIAADVTPVLKGEVSVPYDHYYAPKLVKSAPDWAQGEGTPVGTQLFYTLNEGPDLGSMLGAGDAQAANDAWAKFGSETSMDKEGRVVASDTGVPFTSAQTDTYKVLVKGGKIDTEAQPGSVGKPYMRRAATDTFKPGDYYIDLDGQLRQEPGAEKGGGFRAGFGQGVQDVPLSVAKLLPGTADSALGNVLEANRLIYGAEREGDIGAKAGRFVGQLAATIPAMGAAEGVLARGAAGLKAAAPAAEPALEFLAGNTSGNMLLRGSSLAARGALEGTGASALVSGASDQPVGEQLRSGAVIGGVLGPAAPLVRYGGNRLFAGREVAAPAVQQAVYDTAHGLPVPVPMTRGQITGSPSQQMTENAMLRGVQGPGAEQVMRDFTGRQQAALRGNVEAISTGMAGAPLRPGEGGAAVSSKLNTAYEAAKSEIDQAYTKARAAADGAYLPAAERGQMTADMREALRDYDIAGVPRVRSILEGLDQSPTSSTFTPTDIFEARSKLSTLRASNDPVEAGAAGKAVRALDDYVDQALTKDLISGDPNVVSAWREAIGKRRSFGKLFEGGDLIDGLTTRTLHGEGRTLKISPEDATNYIFGRSDLGFVGKRDLNRDLTRLKGVLGPDSPEWGSLRAEAFMRIARAGEGAPEGGTPQFSGQKFMKAWEQAKTKDPQIVNTLFTPEERAQIDQFAEVAQKATTPVKGGDNPSNSGVYIAALAKKAFDNLGTMIGGGVGSVGGPGGAAVGAGAGRAFDAFMKDVGSVVKARKAVSDVRPVLPVNQPENRLLRRAGTLGAVVGGNQLFPNDTSRSASGR